MQDQIQEITSLAQIYFDGIYEGNTEKLKSIFHESSQLCSISILDTKIVVLSLNEWLERVANRESPKSKGTLRNDCILNIDMSSPYTAILKVQNDLPPLTYTDCLSLVRLPNRWKIVNKLYFGRRNN